MSAVMWAVGGWSAVQFAQDVAAAVKAAATEPDWRDHPLRRHSLERYGETLLALMRRSTTSTPEFYALCDRMERVIAELGDDDG